MARIWDFSASFEPKMVANAMARFWKLDGWKFTTLVDANQRPVDHCPISLEPMEDPVLVCDGHIYDKNSITQWLAEGNKLSPCTREELVHTKLLRIQPFRAAIEKFLRHRGDHPTEAERAAEAEGQEMVWGKNFGLMKSCMELAAFLEQKLVQRRQQNWRNQTGREKRSTAISAGQMACDELEKAIRSNQAEINKLQSEVNGAQQQLEALKRSIEEEAAQVVRRFLRIKPLREKSAISIQRFWKAILGRKGWWERYEKMARHCAMAIACGNEELVNKFLSKGDLDYRLVLKCLKVTDVNRSLPPGITPLHKAAMAGQTVSARLLCKAGADKDAVGPTLKQPPSAPQDLHDASRTPLYTAAQGGHRGVVKVLCELRAEIDKGALLTGASPLFTAAEYGHVEVVKTLCSFKAQVNGSLFDTGLIPLHAAAKNGHFEVVRYLCSCRGDVCKATNKAVVTQLITTEASEAQRGDVLPEVGITPLFLAARGGHAEIVKFLCTAKAEVNRTLPDSGCTTLHMACRKGHQRVVELLLNARASANIPLTAVNRFTPLHAAAAAGCEQVVFQLCEARAETDQPTGDIEATPMYLAAAKGFVNVIKVLCRAMADVNKAPGVTSATPLYMACLNGHVEVVRSLCLAQADLDKAVLPSLKTPLLITAKNGNLDIAKTLCVARADLRKTTSNQVTALHLAAVYGYWELAENLVRNNAELNKGSRFGVTPLHVTALSNQAQLARYLCFARADKNLSAKKPNSTPLMMAALCGHSEVVDVLCEDARAVLGMLAKTRFVLHVAARNGHGAVVWRLCVSGADVNEVVTQSVLHNFKTPMHEAVDDGFAEDVDDDTLCLRLMEDEAAVAPVDPEDDQALGEAEEQIREGDDFLHVGSTALFMASLYGHLHVVQILLQAGALVDYSLVPDRSTPLVAAVQAGHVQLVQTLLAAHANINRTIGVGANPVFVAATTGNLEMVKVLCINRGNVNKCAMNGQFPMMAAAENKYLEIMKVLITFRADVNEVNESGETCLAAAAGRVGDEEMVKFLLESKANANCTTIVGATPLLLAAEKGQSHLQILYILCQARTDPNKSLTTPEELSPLMIAAQKGSVDVANRLIVARADVNRPCSEAKLTPLMIAAQQGEITMIQRLVKGKAILDASTSDGRSALHSAIEHRRQDVVKVLCELKANTNLRAKDGTTPLVTAASVRESQAAKHLVEFRANLNLPGLHDITPVHWAACNGDHQLVEYLMRHRANVNLAATDGNTALHAAVNLEDDIGTTVLQLLLQGEAEVNKENQDGCAPLITAAGRCQVEAVRILCQKRADVESATEKGITPMLLAASYSSAEVAEILLKHRANVDRGHSDIDAAPLHVAAFAGYAGVLRRLMQARAQIDKPTTRGHTALHYAAWGGHVEVTQALLEGGADKHVCVQNRLGVNAFFMAIMTDAQKDHQEVLQSLFTGGDQRPIHFHSLLLHVAVRSGQVVTVTSLCQMRCDVNEAVTDESLAGLMESANLAQCPKPFNVPTIVALEENFENDSEGEEEEGHFEEDVNCEACYVGVTPTEMDLLQLGATPLFLAAFFGHASLIQILLDAKAQIDKPDCRGCTPLSAAAEEGMVEIAKLLCQKKANLNSANGDGLTPLQAAALNAHTRTAEELCKLRADINHAASEQRTALHFAASSQCVDIVRLLCQSRANLDATNMHGHTALAISAAQGNARIVKVLCEAKATVTLRCPEGTALDLAHRHGHKEVAKILKQNEL